MSALDTKDEAITLLPLYIVCIVCVQGFVLIVWHKDYGIQWQILFVSRVCMMLTVKYLKPLKARP